MTDNPLAPALDAIAARLKADAERIAALEADLAHHIATALDTNEALYKAEAELAALKRVLAIAVREIADDRSVWKNADASPPFTFVTEEEVLADLKARAEEGSEP